MRKACYVAVLGLSLFVVGCGEKAEAPLTTNDLGADAKTTDSNAAQSGGNVPTRPQVNPNAPYKPSR